MYDLERADRLMTQIRKICYFQQNVPRHYPYLLDTLEIIYSVNKCFLTA